MSVEWVKRYYEAFNQKDIEAIIALCAGVSSTNPIQNCLRILSQG